MVRVDWETCFHCGIRNPVARPLGGSGFRTTTVLVLLCLAMAVGLNVAAVWNVVRSAPRRIVEVATQAPRVVTPVSPVPVTPGGDVVPAIVEPVPQVATARPDLSETAEAPSIALRRPTMPGTALAITVRPGECVGALPPDTAAASYAVEAPAIRQAIATCRSVPELDSLETRLHADHPDDPALRRGGSVQRRLDARRSALARP